MSRYFHSLGLILAIFLTATVSSFAQIKVGSKDCNTATQLCNNDVIDDQLLSNINRIGANDIPVSFPSCFAPKTERNPFWYQFSPENNGSFEMYLNATEDKDFDFIIFDVTAGCGAKAVLQCNTSQLDLDSNFIGTGVSTDSLNKYEANFPGIQNSWMPTLNVNTGKRYAIYIESRQLTKLDTFQVTFGGTAKFRNIDAKFTANAPYCFGKPVVFTNGTNGAGSISYFWDFGDGKNSNAINPVHVYTAPGSYMVKLVAGNGNGKCVYEDSLLIDIPVTITANAGADVAVCSGKSVNLNASGGTVYAWSPSTGLSNPNIANPSASPTANTNYTVTVSDAQGCKATDAVQATVNTNPIVDAGNDASICAADSVQLNATGAVSYTWSPATGLSNASIGNPFAKPLINSSYVVTGTDALGCSAQDLVSVTLKSLPTANAGSDVTICNGKSTQLAATGGVSYTWLPITGLSNPAIASPIASPTATITYTVTAAGINGCKNTDNVVVGIDPLPTADAGGDATICRGTSVNLNASGGVSYSWSPATGLSNSNISNPIAKPSATVTYVVTATDAKGCVNTDDVLIQVNTIPTISAGADASICQGDSVQISASGATNYSWSPATGLSSTSIGNPFAKPISTTTYIVTGDNGGCPNSDTISITVNQAPIASAGVDVAVCNGKPALMLASGGTAYIWSPSAGLSNANIANPIANPTAFTTYTVTVTGGNGCTAKDDVVVSISANPTANAGADTPICKGTGVTLNASGGLTYLWSPSTGLSNTNTNNPTANPALTTTYTVTATDPSGCQASDDVQILVNDLPVISAGVDQAICSGKTAPLLASGGTTYSWTPAASLSAGNISNPLASPTTTTAYIVTGNNGTCSNTDTVKVFVNALPNASAGADVSVCNGKPATLSASGGGTYTWSPATGLSNASIANPVASPTFNITYTVTVTGANGCIGSDDVVVSISANPIANAGADTPICKGTGVTLNASGGLTYVWSPSNGLSNTNINNPTANPASTTTYTVTVTDATGCQASDDIQILANNLPVINAGADQIICSGKTASLLASGGTNYSWTPAASLSAGNISNPIASPTTTTAYIVIGSNGTCSNSDTVSIKVNALPNANAGADVSVCNGKPATLSASGGGTYVWSPSFGLSNASIANPVASPTVNTTYTVTVTGANGCVDSDDVVVSKSANPIANAGADTPICKGTGATLNATGGLTYSWSPSLGLSNTNTNNPLANPLATTTYTITVTDGLGCQGVDQVDITVNAVPDVDAGADKISCSGDTTQLVATGATNYSWSPATRLSNSSIANPLTFPLSTTTFVVVGSNNICSASDSVKIFANPLPNANAGVDMNSCNGKPASLSASGGIAYSWSPALGLSNPNIANPTALPGTPTIYTVTVTGINSCKAKDQATVTVSSSPVININSTSNEICAGSSATLSASGGNTYLWTPSTGLSSSTAAAPIATPSVTTKYKVLVTDGGGCQGMDSLTVAVNALPLVSAGLDDSTCVGIGVPLTASGAISYIWTPASSLSADNIFNPTALPSNTTTYTVTGTDAKGCKNSDAVKVKITNGTPVDAGSDVAFCFGKSTNLNGVGTGNAFTWSPATGLSNPNIPNPVATPLQTTTYLLSMTDSKGCTNIDSVIVQVVYINIKVSNDTVLCSSNSLTLNANGGTTYFWSPATGLSDPNVANPVATIVSNITYRVDITDAAGCKNFDSVKATTSSIPVVATSNDTTICNGNSASLNATGGVSYVWTPAAGLSNPAIANPIATPGISTRYVVTVSGINGCTQKDTVMVGVTFIAVVASNDTSICFGKFANLSAAGGVNYHWSPSAGLDNPASAKPVATPMFDTDYLVTVTDADGCKNTETVKVDVTYITTNLSADTAVCKGNSAKILASGGVSYSWSPVAGLSAANIANPVASPNATTKYFVVIADNSGCQNIDSITIDINQLPIVNAGKDTSICNGNTVRLAASGGVAYLWNALSSLSNTAVSNPIASPSATTDYVVTATNGQGCSQKDTVKINVNYINIMVSADTAMCLGQSASLMASGGTQYSWTPTTGLSNPSVFNPKANPNATVKYVVSISDALGCRNQDTIEVVVNSLPMANAGTDQSVCLGRPAMLGATGGVAYLWSPPATLTNQSIPTPSAQPLTTTKYAVVVTDVNGCSNSDSVTVNITKSVSGIASASPDTFCSASPVTLNALAGSGVVLAASPYSFDGGKTFQSTSFLNLLSVTEDSTALVMLKDITGCLSDTIAINLVRKFFTATVSQLSPITCAGLNNGVAQISNISGGDKPYSFYTPLNSNPVTDSVFSNLSVGDQVLFVKDRTSCVSKYNINITLNPSIKNKVTQSDAKCFGGNDGEITVSASGGSGLGFKYSLDGSAFNPNNLFKNISTGNHKIVIKDSLVCTDTVLVNVGSPSALNIQVPAAPINPTCFGLANGRVAFTAGGGLANYQYSLSGNLFQTDSIFASLAGGLYKGFVMDANGCKDSIDLALKSPDSLSVAFRILQLPKCGGLGGVLLVDSINGGTPSYKRIVDGGAMTLSDTLRSFLPGNHIVLISDRNGCERSYDIVFDADSNAIKATTQADSTLCFGKADGRIVLTSLRGGMRPYQFSFGDTLTYGGDTSFTNLQAGTYKIFAKNANKCISQFSAQIGQPELIAGKIISQKNVTCFGLNDGFVNLEGQGGRGDYKFSLDKKVFSANREFTNLPPGRDTIFIADKNACEGVFVANIATPDSITASITQTLPASCSGGDGAAAISNVSGGTGTIQFSINRGIDFQTNTSFAALNSGVYTLLIKDANLCIKNINFTINSVPQGLDVAGIRRNTTDIACKSTEKGRATLSNFKGAPAPYLFAIDTLPNFTLDSSFINLNQGIHTIKIKDGNQCNYQVSVTIEKPDTISFSVEVVQLETCTNSDGQIAITNLIGGSGKYSFELDKIQSSPIFIGLTRGVKTLTVLDSQLPTCASKLSVELRRKPTATAFTTKFNPLCYNESNGVLRIDSVKGGIPPYKFSLDNQIFFDDLRFEALAADTFTLYIKDKECKSGYPNLERLVKLNNQSRLDTTYVPYFVLNNPGAITAESNFFEGFEQEAAGVTEIFNIQGGTKPYFYSMNDTVYQKILRDTLKISNLKEGSYTVYLKDTNSCKQSIMLNVGKSFKIPNLFTPNNDSKNDYFEVTGLRNKSTLTVVNRWGTQVYVSKNYDNTWDAADCEDGIYYFELIIPKVETYKGWVQVSRLK